MKQAILIEKTGSVIRLPFDFCIQCGRENCAVFYSFEQRDNNPIAQIAKLAGDVSVLADIALNKAHKVEAPFCPECFGQFANVPRRRQLSYLAFLITIFLTIVTATATSSLVSFKTSLIVLAIGVSVAIGVRVWAKFYEWKYSPDIRRVTGHKIILKVPGKGKIVCQVST